MGNFVMKIDDQMKMFQDSVLRHALTGSEVEVDVSENDFAKNLIKSPQETRYELCALYLQVLGSHHATAYAQVAKRLLGKFLYLAKAEEFPSTVQILVTKLSALFEIKKVVEFGKFPQFTFKLREHPQLGKNSGRTLDIEMEIAEHAVLDPKMITLKKARDARHEAGFSYDVLNLSQMHKIVVCGIPRMDREDCLNQFYKMIIKERVKLIVALNNPCDWVKAIPYYQPEQLSRVAIGGWKISCVKTQILYEGSEASYIPKCAESHFTPTIDMKSESVREFRPRILQRNFSFTQDSQTHEVLQLHYENWPDRQHAPDLKALEILFQQRFMVARPGECIAVHCQGGIGRTGMICALEELLPKIDACFERMGNDFEEAELNIPEMIYLQKIQAPRLGGEPNGPRFAQIYEFSGLYCNLIKRKKKTT